MHEDGPTGGTLFEVSLLISNLHFEKVKLELDRSKSNRWCAGMCWG